MELKAQKPYDLSERTLLFSKRLLSCLRSLPKDVINLRQIDQCARSGPSIGANYIEANDSLSKKDFVFRLRIARKEAKETVYWLDILTNLNPQATEELSQLRQEAMELKKILSAIIERSQ
ncbi:MAG: four helix bundle protein [Actinobacteria bacterium]|nr:four helix bundle protein [Actinomycetota bacterium]